MVLHWIVLPQVRSIILRLHGAHIGSDTYVHDVTIANMYHYGCTKINIGSHCFVGDGVFLDARGGITLEDEVTVSSRVNMISHINVGFPEHPLQAYYPTREARVTIKNGSYIGTAATLLPGVTVGIMAVVGAGAVVTHSVPNKTVVAGIPAKVIRRLR